MRFSLAETMCDPAQYAPLARAAEAAGFHAYTLPDSLAYPEVSDSKYPYTPDGNREFLQGTPFIEPVCLISALGALTERPGVTAIPVTIAAGTTYARFSLFDSNVTPASDIDLYVFRGTAAAVRLPGRYPE